MIELSRRNAKKKGKEKTGESKEPRKPTADHLHNLGELHGIRLLKPMLAKLKVQLSEIPSEVKGEALNYIGQLRLLKHGISCKGKSPKELRRLTTGSGLTQNSSEVMSFSLHTFPKNLRGEEVAETLVCLKLLEYNMKCEKSEATYVDRLAFPASKEGAGRTPIQIKSISLAKHGYEIESLRRALELFKGWYIIIIEHEPEDFLLFVPSDEMKKRFEKAEQRFIKSRPSVKPLRLRIPSDLSDGWSVYSNPKKFIKDVFS